MNALRPAPVWLEQFEARFSEMLRAPLDASSGTWRERSNAYGAEIRAAAVGGQAQLAVYNRQYWFRLFGVLHQEFPLTTLLLGPWAVNRLGSGFLSAAPPTHPDSGAAVDGFDAYLARALPHDGFAPGPRAARVPRRALLQAVAVDQAFREVFRAPSQAAFTPDARALAAFEGARLRWSECVQLLEEDWPLLRLRTQARHPQEAAVPLPAAYPDGPHSWVLCQVADGQRIAALEPVQARLLRALQNHPLHDALARVEQACTPAEREQLLKHAQRWLANGLSLGFWTGFDT